MGALCSKAKSKDLILSEISDMTSYQRNENLVGLNLPDSVANIGTFAFSKCPKLSFINLPGVVSIGEEAFAECYELKEVCVPQLVTIGDNAFRNCWKLKAINFPLATNIGQGVFDGCDHLTHVFLPQAQEVTFDSCLSLVQVNLASLRNVKFWAFNNCKQLAHLSLLSVETIDGFAFADCWSLTRLIFSSSLRLVEPLAFSDCPNLKRIIIASDDVEDIQRIKNLMPAYLKDLVLSLAQSQEMDELQERIRKQAIQKVNDYYSSIPSVIARKLTQGPMSMVSSFDNSDFIQELNKFDILDIESFRLVIDQVVERHISIYRLGRYKAILEKQVSQGFFATCISIEDGSGKRDAVKTKALVSNAINMLMEGEALVFTEEQKILIHQRPHLLSLFPRATIEELNQEINVNSMMISA